MQTSNSFSRVLRHEMLETFTHILLKYNVPADKASACAEIFTTNSLEGIYTHGVNRFARFVSYIDKGYVKIEEKPTYVNGFGAMEQWDGKLGAGPTNALVATDRAMEIAQTHGMGCVALANTNHWMRGGYYGAYAARKGFVFIGWTNTIANMPPWGAKESKLGNNPLVLALPYGDEVIVLDMAMSQYSYGALDLYAKKGELLPAPGGYDDAGNLTTDPKEIIQSRRVLPIGYWKGAGMALLLDILAAVLSGGLATHQISNLSVEHALSQVFIAFDISKLNHLPQLEESIKAILRDYHEAETLPNKKVRYPGENTKSIREENLKLGIPVSTEIWNEIERLKD